MLAGEFVHYRLRLFGRQAAKLHIEAIALKAVHHGMAVQSHTLHEVPDLVGRHVDKRDVVGVGLYDQSFTGVHLWFHSVVRTKPTPNSLT